MPSLSTTLRVLINQPPDPARAAAWTLYDAAGRPIRSGEGTPSDWPDAERKEAVIAATHGRIAALDLPPLPPGRAEGAVRYALEDQLADGADDSHIALSPQEADGTLRVAIVADAWMRTFIEGSRRCDVVWDRALLESDLAEPSSGLWRWCAASIATPGFVRTDGGATMAMGAAHDSDVPVELGVALSRAGARAPRAVRVDVEGADEGFLARAHERTGVEFTSGIPWHWSEAAPAAYAHAIDLLQGRYGPQPRAPSFGIVRTLRPALWIAGIALALHVAATIGQWGWLRWQAFAADRELGAIARAAVPEFAEARSPDSPARALARRERDLRHRAGLAARDDLVPLLARAAPVLGTLPRGALRSLAYADGHLLLDLGKLDDKDPARLQSDLRRSGLVAIVAPTQSGSRIRIGWD
jgi:type II secretion system protein L